LVRGEPTAAGRFYPATPDMAPLSQPRPQIWLGAWGSERRIAAAAPVVDGWLASAYNATPDQYAQARSLLDGHLLRNGREPATVPDAVATAWLYVTESRGEAEHLLTEVLAPTLGRDPAQLGHLPIGSAEHCAHALAAYADAGAREVLLWPIRDPALQLERIAVAASL
jgi:alkanesulfonate monooxygenase SsuD/methylene tetrahydromethanopterin reductase-like flavin-dependent oxidoreductase (luciferase family)